MKTNALTFNSIDNKLNHEGNLFYIKFGESYYEIYESQIAYIEENEGLIFLTYHDGYKFPISMIYLDDFLSKINKKQFFKISENMAVNREATFHLEEYDNYVLLTLNFKKTISLKISIKRVEKFKKWLTNKL